MPEASETSGLLPFFNLTIQRSVAMVTAFPILISDIQRSGKLTTCFSYIDYLFTGKQQVISMVN